MARSCDGCGAPPKPVLSVSNPRRREPNPPGVSSALLAAALFGASTPFAKLLVEQVSPVLLAGLLYLGSGVGLLAWWLLRRLVRARGEPGLTRRDLPWLVGAIGTGGVIGRLCWQPASGCT